MPSPAELEHSKQLEKKIQKAILAQDNQWLSFASFMQMALYEPGLGYYVAGMRKFGEQGDFVTAPEISSIFSQCLANQCQQVLTQLRNNHPEDECYILEFGAGSGIMAADILLSLASQNCLPDKYFILEVSPDLISRQQVLIQQKCPDLFSRVEWLSCLPKAGEFSGVVLANEVLDAMPVHLFTMEENNVIELGIKYENNEFFLAQNATEKLDLNLSAIRLENGYCSEVCFAINPWLKDLSNAMARGVVLLIDYGFPESEYYHPQRNQGTLMCHYKHYAHADFLTHIGLQDITAHVDFTAVATAAQNTGFELSGFTTQADFLMAAGLQSLVMSEQVAERFQQAQEIKKLVLPSEMGELFKVIALSKNFDDPLLGFSGVDHRHRL